MRHFVLYYKNIINGTKMNPVTSGDLLDKLEGTIYNRYIGK